MRTLYNQLYQNVHNGHIVFINSVIKIKNKNYHFQVNKKYGSFPLLMCLELLSYSLFNVVFHNQIPYLSINWNQTELTSLYAPLPE